MAKAQKAIVSEKAIMARFNRKLAPDCQRIQKNRRNSRARLHMGEFHLIDEKRNTVEGNIDLERLTTKINCLAPFEQMERGMR